MACKNNSLKCSRCGGLMVQDHFIDMASDNGGLWVTSWRCISCGEVLDQTILKNRQYSLQRDAGSFRGKDQRKKSVYHRNFKNPSIKELIRIEK